MKNNKIFKKFAATFLAVAILLASAPLNGLTGLDFLDLFNISASAAEYSGTCGENLTWTFDEATGELRIEGTGAMDDYTFLSPPWKQYCFLIEKITIANGIASIGNYAFGGEGLNACGKLASVTIPDSVTSIGKSAFSDCDNLASITLPDSITSIGEYAFYGCESLVSITIPDGVTNIADDTFRYCINLKTVVLPGSVTSIGDGAFAYCEKLEYVFYKGDAWSDWSNIKIGEQNSMLDTYYVSFVFLGSDGILEGVCGTNIVWMFDVVSGELIIDGTGEMKDFDYYYSSNIYIRVTTPWNEYRSMIKKVTIEKGVTRIGEYAFYLCENLAEIIISESVTSIGVGALRDCDNLERITVEASNPSYSSDANGVLFNKDKTELIRYPVNNATTTYKFPDSVKIIGNEAFEYAKNLENVTISDSVTSIGKDAFYNCDSLASVTIGNGITSIGDYAFYSCESLASITIPDSVTSIGKDAFYGCDSLASVTIGNGITSIGSSAFDSCGKLKSVYYTGDITGWLAIDFDSNTSNPMHNGGNFYIDGILFEGVLEISDGATSIGEYKFCGFTDVSNVIIPDSVTSIGKGAFKDCDSLTSVTIPDSVTSIGEYAFYGCESLASITIPNGVTCIGKYMFYNCVGLTNVTIPDNVTSIGEYAFRGCESLTSVTIPVSVTSIGEYAFYCCESLASVTIPVSVTSIGECAFYGCESLASITIPDGVTNIGDYAFRGCVSLTSIIVAESNTAYSSDECGVLFNKDKTTLIQYPVGNTRTSYTIPEGVISIGRGAFEYCENLTDITIPISVTNIGAYAFDSGIKNVYYTGSKENWNLITKDSGNGSLLKANISYGINDALKCGESLTWTFNEETGELVISGTGEMYNFNFENSDRKYVSNAPWSEYCSLIKKITLENGVTSIGDYAFYGCYNCTDITVPESVIDIGDFAFGDCSSLTSVTIGNGVTNIGDYAFYDCYDLTNIIIPDSVTNIGEEMLHFCSNLTSITVAEGNTAYSSDEHGVLFNKDKTTLIQYPVGNTRTSYTIPDSVIHIGDYAFESCGNLNITFGNNVTSIGDFAFAGCSLGDLIMPDSVTTVGKNAFEACSFKKIKLSNNLTAISDGMFNYGYVEEITIPESVTSIGSQAFFCCGSGELTIPGSVKVIESCAFQYAGFSYVRLEDGVETIENSAFSRSSLEEIVIPESVRSVESYAFSDSYYFSTIYYEGTEKQWRRVAEVEICENLDDVYICYMGDEECQSGTCGDNVTWKIDTETDSLVISGSGRMNNFNSTDCPRPWGFLSYFANVVIEDGVTGIGDNAFYAFYRIASITIPDSVTSIGGRAFAHCGNLTSIIIPDSVTSIGEGAFYGTYYARYNGSSLTSITIGSGVTNIGENAFLYCYYLTDVYYNGTEEEWNKIRIGSGNEDLLNATIHFTESEHEHSYTSEITTQPTCTTEGVETFTCECGDSYTQTVPATSHTLSHITVDSTCKVAGMEYDLCSECEGVFNSNKLPLAEHTWSEWTVTAEPTTENEGTKTRICSVCSAEETESIPKLEVIRDEATGIEIVFGEEYGAGVEVQASEIYDGNSFQLVEANYGNVKTTIFDISTTVDGVKVQPTGKVKVRIPLPEGFGTGKVVVCYVDSENGKVTSIPAKVVDGYVEFETDHFSHYALLATKGKVHSVKIDDVSLYYKDTMFIFPKINADDGVKYTVEYSSSKPSVAEINRNGQITAKGFGRTTITCTVTDEYGNTVTDTFKVNVKYTFLQWIIKLFLFGDLWYY